MSTAASAGPSSQAAAEGLHTLRDGAWLADGVSAAPDLTLEVDFGKGSTCTLYNLCKEHNIVLPASVRVRAARRRAGRTARAALRAPRC
jgi:hypothetical protein